MVALGRFHRITKIQQKFNYHIFLLEKCLKGNKLKNAMALKRLKTLCILFFFTKKNNFDIKV